LASTGDLCVDGGSLRLFQEAAELALLVLDEHLGLASPADGWDEHEGASDQNPT
jgi:hypothetical protein